MLQMLMTCLNIQNLSRNVSASLRLKFREEERQRQEALKFAESVKKQNEELKAKLDKLDNYLCW